MIDAITKKWSLPPPARAGELALVGLLVVLGGAVLLNSIRAAREWFEVRRLTQTYSQLTGVGPETMASLAANQRDEIIKRISTNRLIAPPPMQLTGVLGDQAIFNGSMMLKVGQSAGDMKILAIGPNWVQVQSNGQEQKLFVFQSPMSSSPPPPPGDMAAQMRSSSGVRRSGGSPPPPTIVIQP